MMQRQWMVLLLFGLGFLIPVDRSQALPFTIGSPVPMDLQRITRGDQTFSVITFQKDAVNRPSLLYGDASFMADRVEFNELTDQLTAIGNVRVTFGSQVLYGDHLEYNFESGRGMLTRAGMRSSELRVIGGKIEIREIDVKDRYGVRTAYNFEIRDGSVTTCEYAHPHYYVTADFVRFVPKVRVWLYSMVYRTLGIPALYLPYLTRSLRKEPFAYVFEPGVDDQKGFFVLNRFHLHYEDIIHPMARGTVYADVYSKMGLGVGGKWNYLRKPEADSYLYGYYIDQKDGFDETANARVDTEGSRGKVAFQHFQRFGEEWTLTAKGRRLSDPDFDEDYRTEEMIRGFTDSELRSDRDAFVNLARTRTNSNFRFIYKDRLEDFNLLESQEEARSPEFVFESKRRPFDDTNIYHHLNFSVGHYKSYQTLPSNQYSRINPPYDGLDVDIEQEFERMNLNTELNSPFDFKYLSVVPFVGYEGTAYTDATRQTILWTRKGSDPKEMMLEEYNGLFRHIASAGVEFVTRKSLDFSDPTTGIERRFLFSPSVTALTRIPSEDFEEMDPDRERRRRYDGNPSQIRSSNEQPYYKNRLGFPEIDHVDSLRDEFAGLELRFEASYQTRAKGGNIRDLVRGSVFTSVDFTENDQDENELSTVYGELYYTPLDWLSTSIYTEYEPEGSFFKALRNAFRIQPYRDFGFEIAYSRFQFDQDAVEAEEEIAFLVDYVISERYKITYEQRYDLNNSIMRLQKLGIIRDFHDWLLTVGINQTERVSRDRNLGAYFSLSFKTPEGLRKRLPIEAKVDGSDESGIVTPKS